jgi:3-oxoacyl-[acyl-carrier protein] reductase
VRLKGKSAIVTGAAAGIGRGIAGCFAREGARVALADRDLQAARRAEEEIRAAGGEAFAVAADVSDGAAVRAMVGEVAQRFEGIDILVNNAGIRFVRPFLETTEEQWRRTLEVNLTGMFLCCQAAVPHMLRKGKGKVVNLASVAGQFGRPQRAAYCASKGGIIAFTKALAVDLKGRNVCVNALAPALIDTPLNAGYASDAALASTWKRELLAGRWGQPSDVALAALYLASEDADFVTGTVLTVDGGWTASLIRANETD